MRNILLLQLNRLGDLVQTLPLLRRMRRDHPGARIVLVALEGMAGILEGCGYFDTLITVSQGEMDALAEPERRQAFPDLPPFNAHEEFRRSYDLIVNLTSDLGSAILCERMRANRKLGRIDTYPGELRLLGPWAKYLFAMVAHRVDNLFNVVDIHTGMAGLTPAPEPASLPVPAARRQEAEALLRAEGRRPGRKLIALQTGASLLHRAWPLEDFAETARNLMAGDGADILLVGDAKERERVERLAGMIGPGVLNLAGRTSLAQLSAVLQCCDLLVSNDTGTIHVAAAVGVPTLGLYFSTAYFSETAPYGEGHAVLQVEIPCAPCHTAARCPVQLCREYLTRPAVLEAARWMLAGRPDGPPPLHPNLSLYLSRFLANGSLIYLPAHAGLASSHYLAGLLGRLLWEDVLGLSGDPTLEAWFRAARGMGEWDCKRAALAATLASLGDLFRQGSVLAGELRGEFASGAPERGRILSLHEDLTRLGATMAAASQDAGLYGAFLRFEMMDMDYAAYPMLAETLEGKYRALSDWAGRFRDTLARLSLP